ncbi:hypothetical protein ACAG96_08035 [Candidatus Izemoplasma sp. B36]|uniref:hypothetical protein n=1 Tax=Candidatus Izemoplasma sp. B36 TaxID=3242468 RepID=UPI003557FD0D
MGTYVVTLTISYDSSTDEFFGKTTVDWDSFPSSQLTDLVSISHDTMLSINKTYHNSLQYPEFDAKILYNGTGTITTYTIIMSTRVWPVVQTFNGDVISETFNELDTDQYNNDTQNGILFAYPLKGFDSEQFYSIDGWDFVDVYDFTSMENLSLTLEAYFHMTNSSYTSYSFVGAYSHQYISFSYDLSYISVTYSYPYISFSLPTIKSKYTDPVNTTVEYPL